MPKGEWITGGNWDHENWPSKKHPRKELIDAITPDHPVLVSRLDGHMALANSLALKLAGITRDTPDPQGGEIVKDKKTGEPTGILRDTAMDLVDKVIPPLSREKRERAIRAAMRHAQELGVTSVQDNSSAEDLAIYQELLRERRAGRAHQRLARRRRLGRLPAHRHHRRLRRSLPAPGHGQALRRRLHGRGHGALLRALCRRSRDGGAADPHPGRARGAGQERRPRRAADRGPRHRRQGQCLDPRRLRQGPRRKTATATPATASSTPRWCAPRTWPASRSSASSPRSSPRTASTTCAGPRSASVPG